MSAPLFSPAIECQRFVLLVGTEISFSLATFWCWLYCSSSPVPGGYAQGKSGKVFQERSVGLLMKCGGNQMSICRKNVHLRLPEYMWNGKHFTSSKAPTGVMIRLCLWSKYDQRFFWSKMLYATCGAGVCVPDLSLWTNNILFQEILSGLITLRFCFELLR